MPPAYYNTTLPHNSHSALLPINRLDHLVHYPSLFARSGYGYRYLCEAELSLIFGVSQTITNDSHQSVWYQIIPVQILDALLQPLLVLEQHPPPPPSVKATPPINQDTGFTLLPHVNKRLDHGWFQNVVSSSAAAKSDNAEIDNAIWNQRITLIFPALQHTHLHTFCGGLI